MKKSGISLISVVIMVVIMLILASVAMSSGMDSVEESRKTKIDVEISEIKKAVANKIIEIETNPTAGMPGQKITDVIEYVYYIEDMDNSELESFLSEVNEDKIDYYRLVDSISAAALGVASVQEDHYYIVDYYIGKVYGPVNMAAYRIDHPSI